MLNILNLVEAKGKRVYFILYLRTIHRMITAIPTTVGNTVTGIIHVRLSAFQSERKGWFYKSSTSTGIIHVRLAAFLS